MRDVFNLARAVCRPVSSSLDDDDDDDERLIFYFTHGIRRSCCHLVVVYEGRSPAARTTAPAR